MKTVVIWKGKEYEVPSWAKWLAVDGDGQVWIYSCEPDLYGTAWVVDEGNGRRLFTAAKPKRFAKELYKLEES